MTIMQKSPNLHPLTLSHVTHHEESWSSDSDSGITVDSQSPPSKVTPDSGIGIEQPSWNLPPPPPSLLSPNLPPPPPSLLSDDALVSTMDPRDVTAAMSVASPDEEERQRKQDYVRNTLLEYERQKLLDEQRNSALYDQNELPRHRYSPIGYSKDADDDQDRYGHSDSGKMFDRLTTAERRGIPNDYIPSQMARRMRDVDTKQSHVTHCSPRDADHTSLDELQQCREELRERLEVGGSFSPLPDDGYGTDGRSNTTASLSSPLSSSLSSLTTDSSSSLNGSQRGCGSTRAQPVPSGGRLVVARRGLLVKRRELPPVEINQGLTLEDRLRALTTIEEEEAAAPHDSRARPGSGSGGSSEGLYSVINKRPNARSGPASSPRPSPAAGGDRGCSRGGDFSSSSLHRAVPVRVEPEGHAYFPASRGAANTNTDRCADSREMSTISGADCREMSDSSGADSHGRFDRDSEVRFKVGGGGVKLTKSGEFEIDYSYYLKATPSESNDEVNTYSPLDTQAEWAEVFDGGGVAESYPPRRRTSRAVEPRPHADADIGYSPRDDLHDDLLPRPVTDSGGQGHLAGRTTPSSPRVGDLNFSVEPSHHSVHVRPRDSGLRQGGVMCSMPNLSLHAPPPRTHSGGLERQEQFNPPQDSDLPQPITRRNPTPGSGYWPGGRRKGQGERNSCDVGSLYHQSDLSLTFPPTQGVVGDRLSLTMGDLPRIHEQLRATSQMLLSSGKRHQFASSSDIYRLFQGQQKQAAGFVQGRQPPHRHSFHNITGQPSLQNLNEARSRVRANSASNGSRQKGTDQSQTATSPGSAFGLPTQGPVRGNHNISVPDSAGYFPYGSGRENVNSRQSRGVHSRNTDSVASGQNRGVYSSEMSSGSGEALALRETLARGQQFATDVIQDGDGEKLSTLV